MTDEFDSLESVAKSADFIFQSDKAFEFKVKDALLSKRITQRAYEFGPDDCYGDLVCEIQGEFARASPALSVSHLAWKLIPRSGRNDGYNEDDLVEVLALLISRDWVSENEGGYQWKGL